MTKKTTPKWNIRYLTLAQQCAGWSKDPSTKVGAVIVKPDTGAILSMGYNGFPRKIEDSDEKYLDRETKYKYIVHAEMNAIFNACYNGTNLVGSHLYLWPLPPCVECAKGIIQSGISKVIIPRDSIPDRWNDSCKTAHSLFEEAGVEFVSVWTEGQDG